MKKITFNKQERGEIFSCLNERLIELTGEMQRVLSLMNTIGHDQAEEGDVGYKFDRNDLEDIADVCGYYESGNVPEGLASVHNKLKKVLD